MKNFTTLEEIKSLPGRIYVRWSKSIALDSKRGYSLKYGTAREAGLSSCILDKDWEDWRILRQICEYWFCGGSCWIVSGDEVGRGEDNEELLENVVCFGKVGNKLLKTNWEMMKLESEIAIDEERLTRITNEFAIKIITESIEKNKKKLEALR